MSPVIGLGGHLRSGKDTVAGYLAKEYGYAVIGMSDALQEAMLAIDPILSGRSNVDETRYSELVAAVGYVEAKKDPEVRRLLQAVGMEVGRNMFGENVWVNIIARKIDALIVTGTPVAVTSIRYPNELAMIRQFAGRALWVERETEAPSTATAVHSSENSLDSGAFDIVIDNSGSLEDLYATVDTLMEGIPQ